MNNKGHFCFKTEKLRKTYLTGETTVEALRGVDIEIPFGEIVVLLGPSGSGKSTFLNIIGGLDHPSSGQVFFKTRDLSSYSDSELTLFRRENVGFIFQAYNLVPSLTCLENVSLATEISSNPLSPSDALEAVSMGHRANHFPSQISGGEQQRVAIARALAKNPEVLLCDEPTGALDSKTGILVLDAIINVNKKYQTTCVIITHNASIADLADRVIHFADGSVVDVIINKNKKTTADINW
ncbi:MAG: ABC transporter ATP-binding protein [Gammaproteobacteria bacterium]